MSHFLVTGGGGFIGSHLVERLLEEGHRVRVLDDFSTGRRENLTGAQNRAEIVEGSILDLDCLNECMRGIDYVCHQAALPSVARSIENPARSLEANSLGTLRVLEAALRAKTKRVVIASSSSVYGANPRLPKDESMTPMPLSPYAISKLCAEHYAYVYQKVHALETITLRYFNVFGPRQDPTSVYAAVIPKFIRAMTQGRRPPIYGDGKQSRDFTYVQNVVEANILACKAKSLACGAAYNIAAGSRVSLLELVDHLNELLKTDIRPDFFPPRPGEVRHSQARVDRAKRCLRYRVKVSFLEGLRRTLVSHSARVADRGNRGTAQIVRSQNEGTSDALIKSPRPRRGRGVG